MSEALDTQAELLKLARLLGCDPAEVAFLASVPSGELRRLREQATDRLFAAGGAALAGVGVAAKLVPSALAATIAQRAFGPLLCARAAGSTDPAKAVDICRRLEPEFLTEAAIEVDPRRVAAIIARVPAELVIGVAQRLGQRAEYVTMGRFLAFVPDEGIAAAIGVLSDEAVLRTAFVLEHKERLDHAVGLLPPERLPGIIACASREGLWAEALDLLDHLSDARKAPIADIFSGEEMTVIAELVAAVSAAGIWDSLLPIVRLMSPAGVRRLSTVPAFHDPQVLEGIIIAAAEPGAGLWRDLAPLISELPPQALRTAAEVIAALEPEWMVAILHEAAGDPAGLGPLIGLIDGVDGSARQAIAAAIEHAADEHPQTVDTLIATAQAEGWLTEIGPLLELLPASVVARLQT